MSLWDGLDKAQVYEDGQYFGVGCYDVEIVRCLSKKTKKSGDAFIVETEVLNSNNPADPVGSRRTWYQSMKNIDVAHGAVTEFLFACFCLDLRADAALIEAHYKPNCKAFMPRVDGPENILQGRWVHLETRMVKTKEHKDFTKHAWDPFAYSDNGMALPADFVTTLRKPALIAAVPPPAYGALPAAPPPPAAMQWNGREWVMPAPVYAPPPPPMAAPEYSPDGFYQRTNGGPWVLRR